MTTINITTSTTSTTDPNHHHHHHNNNTTGNSNSSKWTTCTASDINVYDSNQNIESSSSSSSSSFSSSSSSTTGNHNCNVLPVYTIIWPGLGLLGESYILFSIGTLYPIWEYIILFSTTNGSNSNDDDTTTTTTDSSSSNTSNTTLSLLHQLPYLTCISIICGMIFFGIYTHYIGRRYGSITTAFFMCCGCCIMTFLTIIPQIILLRRRSYNVFDAQQQYIQQFNYQYYQYYWYIFVIGMILFAFGVGGEYPVAAASATERSMRIMRRSHMSCCHHHHHHMNSNNININSSTNTDANTNVQQPQQPQESPSPSKAPMHETSSPSQSHSQSLLPHKSGQHIQYIFSMQGVGILLQVIILTILLLYFYKLNSSTDDSIIIFGYTIIWLIIYMIGTLILLTVFVTRVLHLKESLIWQQQQQESHPQPQQQHDCLNIDILHATHNDTTNNTWNSKDDSIPNKNKCNNNNNNNNNNNKVLVDHHHLHWKNNSVVSSTTPHDNEVDLTRGQDLISSDHIPKSTAVITKNIHWTILIQILILHSPYGLRLLGVSLSWFLWDVAFYGNKLFQSTFLLALTNNTNNDTYNTNDEYGVYNNDPDNTNNSKYGIESILQLSIAATINASIALCGYYTAANIIDHPSIGRQRLQFYGFIITGSLFVSVGYFYDTLPTNILIIMYFGTSFFGQCGPNATTFILPSEVFPTQLRTICHGAAAASGKLGALVATIVFHRLSNQVDLFLLSGYTSFIAAAVTFWFVPETVGHDLRENDRHWEYIVRSYLDHSTTESTDFFQNPSYLSVYERRRTLWNHNNINSDCEHQYKQYDEAFQLS